MSNLIPGGIYSILEHDNEYYIFIENTKKSQQYINTNVEEFSFFMLPTFYYTHEDVLDDLSLEFALNKDFELADRIEIFSKTNEEMLNIIDGFLGNVTTTMLDRLKSL